MIQTRFTPEGGEAKYNSWASTTRQMTGPGTLRVSVKYADDSKCNDISILEHLTIKIVMNKPDLNPVNYFAKNINYGCPPVTDYAGKHTDTTGLNESSLYAESLAFWRGLPALASGYITETDLGEIFADGPHMYKYVLDPPYQARSGKGLPHVFIVTSVHAYEKSATYGLYYLIKDMLEHAEEDPVLFYLRNFVKFTIIPMANPWGWDQPDSNHHGTRYNENGINLNRNFPTSAWHNFDGDTTYTEPYQYNSRGTEPFSEIETQRIRDAIIAEPNITLIMDAHTNGNNTQSLAEISALVMNFDTNIEAIDRMANAIDRHVGGLRQHMDSLYGTNLGNNVYGTFLAGSAQVDGITQQDWGYESIRKPSMTFEVLAGSEDNYLGQRLTKYSPDVIKLCGEMYGNFICKALHYLGY